MRLTAENRQRLGRLLRRMRETDRRVHVAMRRASEVQRRLLAVTRDK